MNFNSFGEILYFFRKEMDLTQGEICKGICNRRTYMKWESNQLLPSFYYMECLSFKLNIDLILYYKLFQCHKGSVYMHYDILAKNLIEEKNFQAVKMLIPKLEQIEIRPPSFEQLIYLCKIVCLLDENQYELSINYCLSSLYNEDSHSTPAYPCGKIFSDIGFRTLVCLAYSYSGIKNDTKALETYLAAYKLINQRFLSELHFYQSNENQKKIFLFILYNISLLYEKNGMHTHSLEFVQEAFNFSNKEQCLYLLPELLRQKLNILYILGQYNAANECYKSAICLYKLQNKYIELEELKEKLNTQYPMLKNAP